MKTIAAILFLFLLASFAFRCAPIVDNSPYPRHVDEETFLYNSLYMLKTGTLRPLTLNWPSLPIYLALAAESTGYLWERATDGIEGRAAIRNVAFPYTPHATMVLFAKLLFAGISVLPLLFVGLIAWRLCDSFVALLLAPVVLGVNALYFYHSWSYLNVDIVGVFFIVAALAYLVLYADDRTSVLHKALLPGIFCGLAAACKYTNASLAIPFLISIAFHDREKWLTHAALLLIVLGVSFAVAMPYAVIEPDRLLEWFTRQRRIYSTGWPGHTIEAGLPHLARQLGYLMEQYGVGAFVLGLVGLGHSVMRGGTKGLALASYPVLFTLYFCSYRVDMVRNLLAVHALFAVFITIEAVRISRFVSTRLEGLGSGIFISRATAFSVTALILAGTAPWSAIHSAYFVVQDSRLVAERWILENVPHGARLFVPTELRFDLRSLKNVFTVNQRNLIRRQGYGEVRKPINRELLEREAGQGSYFLVPEFGWEYPERSRIEAARAANASFSGGEVLARFGSQPVRVKLYESVPRGDPAFTIRRGDILEARSSSGNDPSQSRRRAGIRLRE